MTWTAPTATDLGLFLGLAEVNADRAEFLIGQAAALAETVVSPLPDTATAVVLAIAARTYVNPQAASGNVVTGPYSAPLPAGGLYLTKDDRRTLRVLSGRGGAFTVNPTPDDVYVPPAMTETGWGPGWTETA